MGKRIPLHIIPLLILLLPLNVLGQLPEPFTSGLERAKMVFEMPEGYIEAAITDNPHMHYEYAVKHPDKKFEIRYAIRPMDQLLARYSEYKAKGATMVHPNNMYPGVALVTARNVSGIHGTDLNTPPLSAFDTTAVKDEFNADQGCTTSFDLKTDFATDYAYCMMFVTQKDDVGTAYYFYLADDLETIIACVMPVFYALKFRED